MEYCDVRGIGRSSSLMYGSGDKIVGHSQMIPLFDNAMILEIAYSFAVPKNILRNSENNP